MEDEIASIAAVIGASLAGVKALTATSGPGFSLMQENIGYAAMAQVPCVIVNVMRGGPSTGLPTEPVQGDVMQARWGTHGEHSIIALVPELGPGVLHPHRRGLQPRRAVPHAGDRAVATPSSVTCARPSRCRPPDELRVAERGEPDCEPEDYDTVASTVDNILPRPRLGSPLPVHVTGLVYNRSRSGAAGHRQPATSPSDLGRYLREKIYHHRDAIVRVEELEMEDAEVAIFAYGSVARSAKAAHALGARPGRAVGLVRPHHPVAVPDRRPSTTWPSRCAP